MPRQEQEVGEKTPMEMSSRVWLKRNVGTKAEDLKVSDRKFLRTEYYKREQVENFRLRVPLRY